MKQSNWSFAVHASDPKSKLIESILTPNHKVQFLKHGEVAKSGQVAIFSVDPKILLQSTGRNGKYLLMASHKIKEEETPDWAKPTAFRIIVHNTKNRSKNSRGSGSNFADALLFAIERYENWLPQNGKSCPWINPQKNQERVNDFVEWEKKALGQLNVEIKMEHVLAIHRVNVLYGNQKLRRWTSPKNLMFMGCVHLNRGRTDVAQAIDSDKQKLIVRSLLSLFSDLHQQGTLASIVFAQADETMLQDPVMRGSLNPFMYSDLHGLKDQFPTLYSDGAKRRNQEYGPQTEEQLANALAHNATILERDILHPMRCVSQMAIRTVSWQELLSPVWSEAKKLAYKYESLGRRIYYKRAQVYDSYNRIDKVLGSNAGLKRALANLVIYLAVAIWAKENPDSIVIDYEYDDQWMKDLKPALDEIWPDGEQPFLTLPKLLRQPWTY